MSADDLRFAIIAGDSKAIAKAPGIGAKSAERIILELKGKIDLEPMLAPQEAAADIGQLTNSDAKNEAIEAMIALGYSSSEAVKAIKQLTITDDMDSGVILKDALKILVRGV